MQEYDKYSSSYYYESEDSNAEKYNITSRKLSNDDITLERSSTSIPNVARNESERGFIEVPLRETTSLSIFSTKSSEVVSLSSRNSESMEMAPLPPKNSEWMGDSLLQNTESIEIVPRKIKSIEIEPQPPPLNELAVTSEMKIDNNTESQPEVPQPETNPQSIDIKPSQKKKQPKEKRSPRKKEITQINDYLYELIKNIPLLVLLNVFTITTMKVYYEIPLVSVFCFLYSYFACFTLLYCMILISQYLNCNIKPPLCSWIIYTNIFVVVCIVPWVIYYRVELILLFEPTFRSQPKKI